jgi:predicted metal-dependent phosphoesterase TrpH
MDAGPLAWAASTPAGARLGQAAVQSLRLEHDSLPWWFAPLEPFRWWMFMVGGFPHVAYTAAVYVVVALLLGVIYYRRAHLARRAMALVVLLLLSFATVHLGLTYVLTIMPHGSRWIVPPDASYVLADLHSHSQFSGAELMPADVIRWHLDRGYHVVAVTDSNSTRGSRMARDFAQSQHLPVIVPWGQEYRGINHLLLLGTDREFPSTSYDLARAVKEASQAGALVIAAHPWTGQVSVPALRDMGVRAVEVANAGSMAAPETQQFCAAQALPEVGNLDFRAGSNADDATVLPASVRNEVDVKHAIEAGECAAVFLPRLVMDERIGWFGRHVRWFGDFMRDGRYSMAPGVLCFGLAWWACRALVSARRDILSRDLPALILMMLAIALLLDGWLGVHALWWRYRSVNNFQHEWLLAANVGIMLAGWAGFLCASEGAAARAGAEVGARRLGLE